MDPHDLATIIDGLEKMLTAYAPYVGPTLAAVLAAFLATRTPRK